MKQHPYPFLWLFCVLCLLLSACGSNSVNTTSGEQRPSVTQAQPATGTFQEYALPQKQDGLMRPAVDSQGRVWFGEMGRNYLGSFDPQTKKFWQQTPPSGQAGIMGLVVAPDDTIWFAEQYANYIGHYSPSNGQYQTYHLPTVTRPDPGDSKKMLTLTSAPNDVALDKRGYLWFTELNASAIGRLTLSDGSIRQYPLTQNTNAQPLNPYGIAVDPQGNIWFTEASNKLGELNPATGQISYFTPPGLTSPLMEVISDQQGQIWATAFSTGVLIAFNPRQKHFNIVYAPAINGAAGGIYGLAADSSGDIWLAITSESLIARFETKAQRFLYYTIPTPDSLPIGLALANDGTIWFTETGSDKLGMLRP